ncbi:hypothetical protein POM88_023037 [Heracleum sosnowskyi]|uniref:Uncharacterized protein n=1 Tax=Heracleum sosnowskyi TaxID=360622 RepID=A0AAD8IJ14_9APIA|nr:hypothetical protein POM88_023037 [Heracleum sosnowskyi]
MTETSDAALENRALDVVSHTVREDKYILTPFMSGYTLLASFDFNSSKGLTLRCFGLDSYSLATNYSVISVLMVWNMVLRYHLCFSLLSLTPNEQNFVDLEYRFFGYPRRLATCLWQPGCSTNRSTWLPWTTKAFLRMTVLLLFPDEQDGDIVCRGHFKGTPNVFHD